MLDNNLSLYLAIAKDLREAILSNVYSYKELLPTEAKLMKKYSVSRTTIRQAINQLVNEGIVKKVQGSGTYVSYRKDNELFKRSANIFPFSEEMKMKGKIYSTKLISFEIVIPDKNITDTLGIKENSKVYSFERLRFGDGFPLCLEHSYMPVEPFLDLTIQHLESSKYHYIEKIKKLKIMYSHQSVYAILSNERLENLLRLKRHSPILKIRHKTYLDTGDVLDLTTIYFSSDYYEANFTKFRRNEP